MIAGLRDILQMCALSFTAFPDSYGLSQSKHSAAVMMGKGVKLQDREMNAGRATSAFSLSNYSPVFILALLTELTFMKWNCLWRLHTFSKPFKTAASKLPHSGWCWANLGEILRFLLWGHKGFWQIYVCPNRYFLFTWEYLKIEKKPLDS